jgi:hypothetical protein
MSGHHRPEQDIHKALADHLRLRAAPGTYWFHPANGARKATKRTVSPVQMADEMRAAGAEIAVAVRIDAALAQLQTWGLLRGRAQ